MSLEGERLCGMNRCPRCGGRRLFRRSAREILVFCGGCGLMTTVPDFPPSPVGTNPETDLAMLRRHAWRVELRFADLS